MNRLRPIFLAPWGRGRGPLRSNGKVRGRRSSNCIAWSPSSSQAALGPRLLPAGEKEIKQNSVAGFFLDEDLDFEFTRIEEVENDLEAVAELQGLLHADEPQVGCGGAHGHRLSRFKLDG
jgi:hypothetical protein